MNFSITTLLLLLAASCSYAAPRSANDKIHERVRRTNPSSLWWIPGRSISQSSSSYHSPVSCGHPGSPNAGTSLFESLTAGSLVVHSCNPGHKLVGAKLRLCQSNGQWTPELPRCVFVDCGDPGAPLHGNKWVGATFLGSIVKYKCNTGFSLHGNSFRVCQSSGKWNGRLPTCTPLPCSKLPSPLNGQVSISGKGISGMARYQCNRGFSLIGPRTRLCRNGVWMGPAPTCQAITCPTLPDIEFGSVIVSSNSAGSVARYVCNVGFNLIGSSSRTCQVNGQWSSKQPECKEVGCRVLEAPENGQVQLSGTSVGSQAFYSCNKGFLLVGDRVRVCKAEGEWSNQAPVCQVVDCGLLSSPKDGQVIFKRTTLNSVASYECNNGFVLIGSSERTCQASGTWSKEAPICKVRGCSTLDDPTNGQVFLIGTTPGALATYICNPGFRLEGARNRVCLANGQWSAKEPTCVRFSCGRLDNPENGQVTVSGVSAGSNARYRCNTGFELVGAATRICLQTGQWSGSAPSCQAVTCERLLDITNGQVFLSGVTVDSAAVYRCNTGFELVGDSSRTCQSSGLWSGAEPSCTPSGCDRLDNPEDGRVELTGTQVGSVATYSCSPGFFLIGAQSRNCLPSGEWSGTAPICQEINCPDLSDIANGRVVISGNSVGSRATYSCAAGFGLVGVSPRICQLNGQWSGEEPSCQAASCPELRQISNGVIETTGMSFGDTATYSCLSGFQLIGNQVRTCQANGFWSGFVPFCRAIQCSFLDAPRNGQVNLRGTTVGSQALYTCFPGFTLSGVSSRTCLESGEWSDQAPTCTAIRCEELLAPANGQVTLTGTVFNSLAIYSCDAGFSLVGRPVRTCMSNGQWSNQAPTCASQQCGQLDAPQNGRVDLDGSTPGSTATYSCFSGFSLIGQTSRICQPNGVWSGSAPFCQGVTCSVLNAPQNGLLTLSGTQVSDTATYECLPGFVLQGPSVRECQANGQWSLQEPTCTAIDCGSLSGPDNGDVVFSSTTFRSIARYSCESGFGLVGVTVRTCEANGEWSGTAPTCQIAQCPGLDTPANGNIETTGMDFWDTATYSCNRGFILVGVDTRTCQANGAWSGNPAFCTSVQCPILEAPKDGQVQFTSTAFGAVATYRCHSGFLIEGDEERTCQADGSWSGAIPICRRVDCGILIAPKNGDIDFSLGTSYGSVATYSCVPPFQLDGSPTRVCLNNGQWSGVAPSCESLECPNLRAPDNGDVLQSGSFPGSTASYTCDRGFSLIGDQRRICQGNGFWTGVIPLCQRTECDELKPPEYGDVKLSGLTIGSHATYACDDGFELLGNEFRTCEADGEWSGTDPNCQGIDCGSLSDPLNGIVELKGTNAGDTATYRCNTGFVLFGKGIRECHSDGTWNGKAPECREVNCGRLNNPINGFVSVSGTTFGLTATYSCDAGFELVGFSSRVCEITGSWSGEEPVCAADVCPTLVAPANGNIAQGANEYGDTAVYSCNAGFTLTGVRIRTCLDDGQWSGKAPVCEGVLCGFLQAPENSRLILLDGTSVGSVARYECNPGFVLSGSTARSCESDGNWSGVEPVCEIVHCETLSDPDNGRVSISGTSFGSEATYTCLSGFLLVGAEIRTCTADRSWSLFAPECVTVEEFVCKELDAPQNGQIRLTGITPGSVATYRCNSGFSLTGGNENRRCIDGTGWDGAAPTCEPVDCGDLISPENGEVLLLQESTLGATAIYSCDLGFLLVGTTLRQCEASGEWSPSEPICSPIECTRLSNPLNGLVIMEGVTLGSIATYSCGEGFNVIGQTTRICESDGNWSDRAPTCTRIGPLDCEDPGVPVNGRRLGDDFRQGATVYYECNEGFQLTGSSSRVCQGNGLWNTFLPTCVPISIDDDQCISGRTSYDICGRQCTCVGGQVVDCCRVRVDFAGMSSEDKNRFISAIIRVATDPQFKPRYDALVALYKSSSDTDAQGTQPSTSQFLPWNRYFMIQYENLLREIDCKITLPYWDWTALSLNPYLSPVFDPLTGFGDTSRSNDSCVSSGPFNFNDFSITPSAGGGCLKRDYRVQMFPTRAIVEQDLLTLSATSFNEFHQFLQVLIHTNVRCYIGGQMCSPDAANDPLYLLHLAQIDFVFDRWQRIDPSRLNVRFASDNSTLSLTNLMVSQFANNNALADDVCILYDHPQLKNHVPQPLRFLSDALEQMTKNHELKMLCVGNSEMKLVGVNGDKEEEFMDKMCKKV